MKAFYQYCIKCHADIRRCECENRSVHQMHIKMQESLKKRDK